MTRFASTALLGASFLLASRLLATAAPVPCEDMLKDLRAAEAAATLSDDVKAKVSELESKGIDRCNADDDRRADDFFVQAMKLVGK